MPHEELTRPLGLTPTRRSRRLPLVVAAAALVVLVAGGAAVWLTRGPAPATSASVTIAATPAKPVDTTRTASLPVPPKPPAAAGPAPVVPAATSGLTEIKPTGTLTEVGKVVIYDPTQSPPMALRATPDLALLETGAYGPLPKTGADGRRPLDAYARPAQDNGGPRIAIVVGGVGIDAATTRDAINILPGPVALALAPYGSNLTQTQSEARAAGHELLLQIPLEPYGYPQTNPGPHTLTASATVKSNLDNLSWLLSRATNYVGVVNYMGAVFTTQPQPMTALLDAVGRRGLLYLDDGSSARSLAADLAPGRAPFLKADLVLDPDLTPAAIDARLDQLVMIARQRGFAVATATAFPATIERIAAFARNAKARDVTLVPVSSLVAASPQ
jgi:polysaccharide deacetylase 2 family uncharacterized protein YibQ